MTTKLLHLKNGSSWPLLQQGTLRLYSMHFCPYAQRTRLVLEHKHIPHEIVNVDLKYKPDWFLERNPDGLVPVLEYNGQVVCESIICDDYLDEVFPDKPLYPADPLKRARHKLMIHKFEKVAGALGQVKRRNPEVKRKGLELFQKSVQIYEDAMQNDFFSGTSPGMIDYHIWPWYERIPAIETLTNTSLLPATTYPKLTAWMSRMMQVAVVQSTYLSDELHMQFMLSLASGQPNYDAAFQANL